MKQIGTILTLAAAIALPCAPATAKSRAERPPLTAEQVAAATRYALPHLYSSLQTQCSPVLSSNGYLALNRERLAKKFTDGADENWVLARDVLFQFSGQDADSAMADLPDEALKPFVDGMIGVMIAGKIKPADCDTAERVLETLDPMPADNVAQLIGVVVEKAEQSKRNKRQSRIKGE